MPFLELEGKPELENNPRELVGEVVVGGFQQLVQADQSGRLAELTAQAA